MERLNTERFQALEGKSAKEFEEAIESFVGKFGLTEYVNAFLESDDVNQILKQAYIEMDEGFKFYTQNVPEELKERAEVVLTEWSKIEERFKKDIRLNFKYQLLLKLNSIPDSIIQHLTEIGLIVKFFGEEGELALQVIQEISDVGKKAISSYYLDYLYSEYVPAGMPKEVYQFVKRIGGGSFVIPLTAICKDSGEACDSDESYD